MTDSLSSSNESWTIRVEGGPAFMSNCIAALNTAAGAFGNGPTKECLVRLAWACAQAEREDAEDRDV